MSFSGKAFLKKSLFKSDGSVLLIDSILQANLLLILFSNCLSTPKKEARSNSLVNAFLGSKFITSPFFEFRTCFLNLSSSIFETRIEELCEIISLFFSLLSSISSILTNNTSSFFTLSGKTFFPKAFFHWF